MKPVTLIAHFRINSGKTGEFKKIIAKCIEVVKEKEAGNGTLSYEWYFNADESECKVLETYRDSNAVLAHAANVGPYLGQFFEISTFSGELFGNASGALKEALSGFDITYYEFDSGI
jgi:quinol monooxygenase YgiN